MRVDLFSLESFYDNSLALDYLSGFARIQPGLRDVRFKTFIHRAESNATSFWDEVYGDLGNVVGFNTYVWNIEATITAAREIKRRSPKTTVILGGMEAAYGAPRLLSEITEIDFVVIGEGEITFSDLLQRIYRGEQIGGRLAGLAYRNADGNVVSGGPGPIVQKLDDIPSPFLDLKFQGQELNHVLYESYRGCAFSCGFCLYHRDYTKQRYFSSDRVEKDIKALRRSGCTHIRFVDSTFNINRARTKEILRYLHGIESDVSVEVSAEFFDRETIDMFPRAGIRHVDIGLQSTNRIALATVNREWYRENTFRDNLIYLQNHPALTLNVELIAGLPSDDYEGLKHSVNDAVSLWPDHISIYRLLGLRGTEIERQKEKLELVFSQRPPYELIESKGFPRATLEKVELLTFAHLILFNLGIARYAFKFVLRRTGMDPASMYEKFCEFVLSKGLYDRSEALLLSRFYAYGNRLDRTLPPGLDPQRVRDCAEAFFLQTYLADENTGVKQLAAELMDYGLNLALLDLREDEAKRIPEALETDVLHITPWCQKVGYSVSLYTELIRQGSDLGKMAPDDISAVLFFVHPEYGPATLAIDHQTEELLAIFDEASRPTKYLTPSDKPAPIDALTWSDEEREALRELTGLRILSANAQTPQSHYG